MYHVRFSICVALFTIANAALGVDDESANNLEGPALDSFTPPTSLDSNSLVALNNDALDNGAPHDKAPNTFALDDFAPSEENLGSVGTPSFPTSDTSGVTQGLTAVSDSGNCAENLGKREDKGLTICHYSFPQPSIFTALND